MAQNSQNREIIPPSHHTKETFFSLSTFFSFKVNNLISRTKPLFIHQKNDLWNFSEDFSFFSLCNWRERIIEISKPKFLFSVFLAVKPDWNSQVVCLLVETEDILEIHRKSHLSHKEEEKCKPQTARISFEANYFQCTK